MTEGPTRSARTRRRGVALAAAFCVLAVGPGCERQTFDLLDVAGNAGNPAGAAGSSGTQGAFGGGGSGNEPDGGSGRVDGHSGAGAAGEGFGGGLGASGGVSFGGGFGHGGSFGSPPGCVAGEPCIAGGLICPPTVPICQRCDTNKDCEANSDSPYCIPAIGRCVQCRPADDDCAIDEVCYPLTLRCAHHCQTSAQCVDDHSRPICDPQFGACVACMNDSNCRAFDGHPTYCALGSCVECDQSNEDAPTPAAAQCPADRPFCFGFHCQSRQR